MTSTYIYNYNPDFPNGVNKPNLSIEIDESEISEKLHYICISGGKVRIHFKNSLSTEDQTILDNVISNHDPSVDIKQRNQFYTINVNRNTKNTRYSKMGMIKYDGSSVVGDINYIDVISSSKVDYDVRIWDKNNGKIIAEKANNTNTSEQVINMGTVSNVPETSSIFEVQAKRANGTNKKPVYIDSIIIYYGN